LSQKTVAAAIGLTAYTFLFTITKPSNMQEKLINWAIAQLMKNAKKTGIFIVFIISFAFTGIGIGYMAFKGYEIINGYEERTIKDLKALNDKCDAEKKHIEARLDTFQKTLYNIYMASERLKNAKK
jgi:hypothetical protein